MVSGNKFAINCLYLSAKMAPTALNGKKWFLLVLIVKV